MAKKLADSVFWEFKVLDEIYSCEGFSKLSINLNEKDFDYKGLVEAFLNIRPSSTVSTLNDVLNRKLTPKSETQAEERKDPDNRLTFQKIVTTCNNLKAPVYTANLYDLLRTLNDYLSSPKDIVTFDYTENPSILDVMVLSSLSRCKIWSKILRAKKKSNSPLPNLFSWYCYMNKLYKPLIDYQIDPTIQTRKFQKQTFRKQLEKFTHPVFIEAVKLRKYNEVEAMLKEGVDLDSISLEEGQKTALCIACE